MANLRKQADMADLTALCGCGRKMALDALRGRGAFRCICGARVQFHEPPYRANQCVAPEGNARCRRTPKSDAVVPLCRDHREAWKAALELISLEEADTYVDRYAAAAFGIEDAPPTADAVSRLAIARVERMQSAQSKLKRGPVDPQCDLVYYMRFDTRVKIGTTTNLPQRLTEVPHDELLAIEPGGRTREKSRHEQFAELRTVGEWFRLEEPLIGHIREIRRLHGWKGLTV